MLDMSTIRARYELTRVLTSTNTNIDRCTRAHWSCLSTQTTVSMSLATFFPSTRLSNSNSQAPNTCPLTKAVNELTHRSLRLKLHWLGLTWITRNGWPGFHGSPGSNHLWFMSHSHWIAIAHSFLTLHWLPPLYAAPPLIITAGRRWSFPHARCQTRCFHLPSSLSLGT